MNSKNDIVDCEKCFHFVPLKNIDSYGTMIIPASCNHPKCFQFYKRQNEYGNIITDTKRIMDIIDFNLNGDCSLFEKFYYKEIKKKWWIFKWTERIKIKEKNND